MIYLANTLLPAFRDWFYAGQDGEAAGVEAVKRLVASGAELRPFPQPVMEACYTSANEIYAELAQTNPHFKKMLDSLTAFRSDSYQWLQVAELAYGERITSRHSRRPGIQVSW